MNGSIFAKSLIALGVALLILGLVLLMAGRIPYLGRLPGDIAIKREHFSFYFPFTTCLVLSLLLTLVARFFGKK